VVLESARNVSLDALEIQQNIAELLRRRAGYSAAGRRGENLDALGNSLYIAMTEEVQRATGKNLAELKF
jgi:hypothetical protein